MSDHFSFFGWGGGMGFLWIFLVVAVVWLLVSASRGVDRSGETESARSILDKRYAKGEIDQAEYKQRLKDLGES